MSRASAGNVCTIKTAQKLDILDDTKTKFKPGYEGINLFNVDKANNDKYSLCQQNKDGSLAYSHCALSAGIGFAPISNGCMPYGCPPGFAADEKQFGKCKKPIYEAVTDGKTRCDERWNDWFSIRNYHLGNRYQMVNSNCLAPCDPYLVPNYATDPVEAMRLDFTSTDNLTTCINKADYFGGKYDNTSDYCPIAWVKRVGSTKESLKRDMTEAAAAKCGDQSPAYADLVKTFDEKSATLAKEMHRSLENVAAGSWTMQTACSKLATTERLADAYKTCNRLKNDNELFMEEWAATLTPEERVKNTTVLEQACDALFCKESDAMRNTAGKPLLCFQTKQADVSDQKPTVEPEAISADLGKQFFASSAKSSIYILIVPIILLIVGWIFVYLIFPIVSRTISCHIAPFIFGLAGKKYQKPPTCFMKP